MTESIEPTGVDTNPASNETVQHLAQPPAKPTKNVHDWLRDLRMSADVNQTTVGVATDRVTPELMLATANKLLGISRREVEPDPKDSLQFQRVYGPNEYFSEHILRDAGRLGRQLLWKATNKGNLDFMQTAALDGHVSDVFNSSRLSNMIDGSSPLETVDAAFKVTRIGEGGVGDVSSAPDEMRLVQPSFLGYVDSVRSPESMKVGLDTYLTKYCMKGSDGKLYQKFINAHTGKPELVDSVTAAKSVVTTPDMMNAKTNFIYALGGKTGVRIVPKKSVDYYLPKMDQAFSTAANLVTGLSGVKEMRLLMGCLHPLATLMTIGKDNMVSIDYAKDVSSDNWSLPGADKEAMSNCRHRIRATIAKFPPGRAWFRKIVLYSGRALTTSKDHRWAVLRDDKIELVDAVKLKPGDKIFRRMFNDFAGRRTFVLGVQVDAALAALLGYMARGGSLPAKDTVRVPYEQKHRTDIDKALCRLHLRTVTYHGSKTEPVLSIHDKKFADWFAANMGQTPDTRRIPSEILSAKSVIVASFLDAYTADTTKIAQDAQDYTWILSIGNFVERDGIAFLLSRIGTDTYYRDAYQGNGETQLALKLTECTAMHGALLLDAVKSNLPVQGASIMIDVDADDNLYASASGIITHNSKYPLQAISIEGREAPYVRNIDSETGKDIHSAIGKYLGARFADKPGVVTAVRQNRIDVQYDDGTKGQIALYNNFPMNAKGYITNTPRVKAGDRFGKGGLLASSNYTDDKGVMATGTNLRVGWLSWKGGTYEDAVVLSESAARKLTGSVMYSADLDLDKTVTLGKRNYRSWKPGEYTKEQLSVLNDDGIVMPGTILHKGDPMVLAVRTTEPSPGTMGKRILTDVSQVWEHDNPGKVTDVVRTRGGVKVLATVTTPVEVGDKVSGLYGNKGVCSMILPDDQMPVDKDGKPLDMILSPLGLISRTNPTQLMETLLGKIAHKTGKTELIDAFPENDMHQYVIDKLKQNKLNAEDDFFDPETGRKIQGVVNGYSYIHRLKHLAESKESARGTDAYSTDDTPGGSGYAGAKRFGTLEQSAMAGHAAFDNLLDNKLIRGQSNADFWRSIRTGGIPTIPGEPLVQKKFFAHLQGSGVNVRKTQKGISVFALSNSDVEKLAGPRELKSRDTYEARTFRPIDGGLFGQDVFGQDGDQWGYIQLDEPVPNPVMEEPLARLLRMSVKDFTAAATGEAEVNGIRGPLQLKQALSKIDLDMEAKRAMQEFKDAPASKRDNALKRYVDVENMRRAGLNPSEYMLDRIPVLPAQFRPVTSHNGLTMVADANYLYAQLLDARDDLRDSKDLPVEYQDKARANLYKKWQELTGLYDPEDVKLRNKNVGGLLKWALGTSPKFSAFQRKVLGGSVDTVGRGAIVPNSKLTMDQIGIPIGMAFDIMAPFVERGLVKRGYTPVDAMKMVKQRDKQAADVLNEVIKTHPVEMNRAPTLHKFNIMAFEPVLVQGHAIQVHPSVCPGFNADFDGDQQIGSVKVRISMDLLQNKNIIQKLERDELQKIIAILYYVAGKNGLVCEPTGDIDMAYHKLKTLVYTYRTDGQYVVLDMDLADIPHGRLVTKNGGIKGNADFYEALPGLQVLAYDEKIHKTVWADVAYWSEHKGCAVEIVHLGNGLDIITDDDPRAVYGIAKDADTLVPKRYTPTEALAENVLVPCTLPGLEVSAPEGEFRYVRECDGALFKQDMADQRYELDFAFGQLLGILAGDGWWDKVDRYELIRFGGPRGVYVSDNEGMNAAYVERYLNTYVDHVYTYKKDFNKDQYAGRYGDTVRYAMYGEHLTPFCEFLTRLLGGSGDASTAGSGNKHLPDWMRAAPYEFRRGLLCGLIATDGSISVSEAKNKSQLMIGFCSTSLRLCRELMTLCRSLGVRTSITFSKTTLRGNSAWQVTLSAFDAKKLGLFNDCVNERKAAVFRDTVVNCDEQYSHGDYRVFPKCVVDVVLKWLRAPSRKKTTMANMSEEEQEDARKILSLYMSVAKYKALGYVTRGVVCQLKEYAEAENTRRAKALDTIRNAVKMLEGNVKCTLDETWKHSMWRALNLLEPQLDHKLFTDARCLVSRRATTFGQGCQGLLDILRKVLEAPIAERYGLSEEPVFVDWLDMVLSGDCMWTTIDNVEKTGQVETGYDLTVPGYETFVSSDGVVLSNTVNVHVPVSDNARKEAMERMRPSRNLIAPSDRKIMYKPEKEYMQGLYFATRLGQPKNGRVQIFRTMDEAQEAYEHDIIDVDTPIRVLELEQKQ